MLRATHKLLLIQTGGALTVPDVILVQFAEFDVRFCHRCRFVRALADIVVRVRLCVSSSPPEPWVQKKVGILSCGEPARHLFLDPMGWRRSGAKVQQA